MIAMAEKTAEKMIAELSAACVVANSTIEQMQELVRGFEAELKTRDAQKEAER